MSAEQWTVRVNGVNQATVKPGERIEIGRKPLRPLTDNGVKRVEVEDSTKSMSKRHAIFAVNAQGTPSVRDLGSTNGSYVVRDNGDLLRLPAGTEFLFPSPSASMRMQFGDVPVDFLIIDDDETGESAVPVVANLFENSFNNASEPDAADMSVDQILDLRAGEPTAMFSADSVATRVSDMNGDALSQLAGTDENAADAVAEPVEDAADVATESAEDADAVEQPAEESADVAEPVENVAFSEADSINDGEEAVDFAEDAIDEQPADDAEYADQPADESAEIVDESVEPSDEQVVDEVPVEEFADEQPAEGAEYVEEPAESYGDAPVEETVQQSNQEYAEDAAAEPVETADADDVVTEDAPAEEFVDEQPAEEASNEAGNAWGDIMYDQPAEQSSDESLMDWGGEPQQKEQEPALEWGDEATQETAAEEPSLEWGNESDDAAEAQQVQEPAMEWGDEPAQEVIDPTATAEDEPVQEQPVEEAQEVIEQSTETVAEQPAEVVEDQPAQAVEPVEQTAAVAEEETEPETDVIEQVAESQQPAAAAAVETADNAQPQSFKPAFEEGSVFDRVSKGEYKMQEQQRAIVVDGLSSDDAKSTQDFAVQFEMARHSELLSFLAMNPYLYDDLYAWLAARGERDIDEALAKNEGYKEYLAAIGR